MALRGGGAVRVRMPSTRWQKWGGSDRPFPILGSELKADRSIGSRDVPGDEFNSIGSDVAPAGKRQSLKRPKPPGKDILAQKFHYRNI